MLPLKGKHAAVKLRVHRSSEKWQILCEAPVWMSSWLPKIGNSQNASLCTGLSTIDMEGLECSRLTLGKPHERPRQGLGGNSSVGSKYGPSQPSHQTANVQIAQILFCSACLTPIKIVRSRVRSIRVTYVSAKIQISLGGLHQAALFAFSHVSSRENSRPPARQHRVRA